MSDRVRRPRAAELALSILSDPLDVRLLQSLSPGPASLADLRRRANLASPTALRNHLRRLVEYDVLTRHQKPGFPGPVAYELTSSGRGMEGAIGALAGWLSEAPGRSVTIGSPEAKAAIKALLGGWSTNVLRALAVRPLSLTELDRVISDVNYPALERRLDAMRLSGLVARIPKDGLQTYAVTDWMRGAMAPIVAAADWERRLKADVIDLGRLDVETIFLIAAPNLRLPPASTGLCRLEVRFEGSQDPAEVSIAVDRGRAKPRHASADVAARCRLKGSAEAWLDALSGLAPPPVSVEGDRKLGAALISAMQKLLARN